MGNEASFADLVGVPYKAKAYARRKSGDPLDCYGVVREGLMRLGVELPARPELLMGDAWKEWGRPCDPLGPARLGDVVVIRMKGGTGGVEEHLGLCINPFEFLHATSGGSAGSRTDKIDVWVRSKLIVMRVRPLALEVTNA